MNYQLLQILSLDNQRRSLQLTSPNNLPLPGAVCNCAERCTEENGNPTARCARTTCQDALERRFRSRSASAQSAVTGKAAGGLSGLRHDLSACTGTPVQEPVRLHRAL